MNEKIRNPHTFDMSSYYTGLICVLGGVDRQKEKKNREAELRREETYKLDWSFLKNTTNHKTKNQRHT